MVGSSLCVEGVKRFVCWSLRPYRAAPFLARSRASASFRRVQIVVFRAVSLRPSWDSPAERSVRAHQNSQSPANKHGHSQNKRRPRRGLVECHRLTAGLLTTLPLVFKFLQCVVENPLQYDCDYSLPFDGLINESESVRMNIDDTFLYGIDDGDDDICMDLCSSYSGRLDDESNKDHDVVICWSIL